MAETTKVDLGQDVETLKSDLTKLRGDLSTLTSDLMAEGRQSTADFKDRVETGVKNSVDSLKHCIEERPVQTTLIALGAGVIIGAFLGRR